MTSVTADSDLADPGAPEPLGTAANAITLVRTIAALVVGSVAVVQGSLGLLAVGYGIYWVGDIADGAVARLRGEETRHGAVFDIIGDRGCTAILGVGFLIQVPDAVVPITLFLAQFLVLDCLLTLSFLHFPLLGPNYFATVDRTVWWLNWSPPAKALNTAAVVLLVAVGFFVSATIAAAAVTLVKVWSLRRVLAIIATRRPEGG